MRNLFIFLYKFKIFKRVVPSIVRRFYSKKKLFIQLEKFQIFLNIESSIDREIYLKGYYDKEKIDFTENKVDLKKFDLFLDIGSYIGYYSLYLASKYKNLKVISFEPILESFNQIKKSKEVNNFDKMEIFQFALSNENAEKNFWVTDLKKKSGFALLDDKDLKREVNENKYNMEKISYRKIKTKIFDQIFKFENKFVYVKIDVERHEFEVLKGAINFFSKTSNKIFLQIEIVDHMKDKVLNLLKEYNFQLLHDIDKGGHDYYLSNYKI